MPMMVSCACGEVVCEASGAPIGVVACYCDDCQKGSHQIELLPKAPPVLDADGGTGYVLYRKDRLRCLKGQERLRDMRLKETSPTRRVFASCCNSAMYLDFEKGHWLSAYRGRFAEPAPAVQMRIQTRFAPAGTRSVDGVASYPGFAFSILLRLVLARIAMLLAV